MTAPWNGLPDQPERIGWHWLKHPNGNYPQPFEWIPDTRQWVVDIDGEGFPEEMADSGYQYICRCPYPSELAQMRQDERERCAKKAREISDKYYDRRELDEEDVDRAYAIQRMCAAAKCALAIRALPDEEGKKS